MTEASIFAEALGKASDQERAAYLAEACAGDEKLRRRVEALLRAHAEPDDILDRPEAAVATVDEAPITERPGSRVGPYRLMEQIGEGGFGLVFVAEQTEPVRRKVALKVIKPGMDSRQVIARFEAERQALALMDHPNIAKVLEAGTTDSGRPYFVMELVRGIPITEYCDQNQLMPRERLELFVSVCQAIQHAHQKGIIHRDVKPSNVLVTSHDGKPVAKVIDFGVAKAIHQQLTNRTIYTQFAQMIGTPLYMSPEQAEMSGLDIDTRSDIYSLGVLLYELLTGTTPLERKRFAKAAYDEIRRLIREEEPPKPSHRLSTSDTLPSVAACRKMDPTKLTRMMRGELDWIVMKALEKDRTRRYETASGLAKDVQRYPADELVEARPPSASYRLRKFARKNRAALAVATAMALLLVGGVAASWWQAQKAHSAAEAEKQAKETAQEREAETLAVLDFVENQVFARVRPEGLDGGLGPDVKLRQALEAALRHVDESFRDKPLVEARLRLTLGVSFLHLGELKIAAGQLEKARTIYTLHRGIDHPDTLISMHRLGDCYRDSNRLQEAFTLFEEVVERRKAILGPDHLDTLLSMLGLAETYNSLGQPDRALPLAQAAFKGHLEQRGRKDLHTLWCMNSLGCTYARLGRYQESLELNQEALALYKETGRDSDINTITTMMVIGAAFAGLHRHKEAIELYKETLVLQTEKLGPRHNYTQLTSASLAWLLVMVPDEKLRDMPKAYELANELAELQPTQASPRVVLGIVNYRTRDWKAAIADLNEGIKLVTSDAPEEKAIASFFLAMAHWQLGEKDKAGELYAQGKELLKKCYADDDYVNLSRTEASELLGLERRNERQAGVSPP
jgi:serine/threonine protein kinase/tetratricopeptide (TPR) repeat protein